MADITVELQDAEGEGEQDGPHGPMDTMEGNWDGKASRTSQDIFWTSSSLSAEPTTRQPLHLELSNVGVV